MWARSTPISKGQATLFFILMAAAIMVMMFGVTYVIGRFLITDMESILFVKMEINDEGRELASFLEAGKTESHYMEILGQVFAKGGHLEYELENIENTIESIGKDCILIYKKGETEPLRKIGKCQEGLDLSASSESEIPIPGAVEDEIKGRVRLHEYKE